MPKGFSMRYKMGLPKGFDAPTLEPLPPLDPLPEDVEVTDQRTPLLVVPNGPPIVVPKTKIIHPAPGPIKVDPAVALQIATLRMRYKANSGPTTTITRILSTLPAPHENQIKVELSTAKRKVVVAGRRGGKTTGAARVAVMKMCEGRRVLLASTTQDQADAFWEKCKEWLEPFIRAGFLLKNETRRIIECPATGGRIKVKTASDADTLRGDNADFLVLDECALLAPDAWDKVGAPMLLDNDGDAWFLSTPRHRNWFYRLYVRCMSDTSGRWEAFHFTSYGNPHLSEVALSEITEDLSDESYRQEILAEFLPGEGAVFRNITANMMAPYPAFPDAHIGHFIVQGVDWAQKRDYTAISTFCSTCKTELDLERFNNVEWQIQRDRLATSHKKWHVSVCLAEENSIGSPNIEAMRTEKGIIVEAFNTNMKTKGEMIRSLALSLERNEDTWINNAVGVAELEAYESKVSKVTGHVSYSAPDGINDDTVMARALAKVASMRGSMPTFPQSVSFSAIVDVDNDPDGSTGDEWVTHYQPYAPSGMRLPGLNYGNK